MATRLNRYYNNPAIGQAFENIASMFAPPSAQEIAGYAQAAKARKEAEGLDTLYRMAGDPNADQGAFDRWGAVTGSWLPTQGFGARDMADATDRYGIDTTAATARRGQDVTANTALQTNRLDNRTRLIGDLFRPLSQGQARPDVPGEFLEEYGFPGLPEALGPEKPLTESEVEGALLQDAIGTGMIGPKDAADLYRSGINIEQVIGADIDGDGVNDPVNVARGDAIGRQPYNNPGSAPAGKFEAYRRADGSPGIAYLDPATRKAYDQATGEELPFDAALDTSGSGAAEMTTGASTEVQNRGLAITSGLETLGRLEQLIANNPAAQGVAGLVRGTAQDAIRAGNELGQLFGGTIQDVTSAAAADPELQAIAGQMYDPNIPAIEMLENVLAWQYAKSFAGSRVSNEQLRIAKQAIGSGALFGNQQSSLARLRELRNLFQTEGRRLSTMLPSEISAGLAPLLDVQSPDAAPAATPGGGPAPGTVVDGDGGIRYRFKGGNPNDRNAWELVQ